MKDWLHRGSPSIYCTYSQLLIRECMWKWWFQHSFCPASSNMKWNITSCLFHLSVFMVICRWYWNYHSHAAKQTKPTQVINSIKKKINKYYGTHWRDIKWHNYIISISYIFSHVTKLTTSVTHDAVIWNVAKLITILHILKLFFVLS